MASDFPIANGCERLYHFCTARGVYGQMEVLLHGALHRCEAASKSGLKRMWSHRMASGRFYEGYKSLRILENGLGE